jgi:pimeloyl-ACP methyl ester carboxylesterase
MNKYTKTFFILPGFKEQASDTQYSWLVSYIENSGWHTIEVPITWNQRTLSQNAEDFIKFYDNHKTEQNQILGFSYGAVITLLTAEVLRSDHIYLCSLSPDFKEDIGDMSPWIRKYIGKRRYEDALTRSATNIARNLSIPTTIFYGEIEGNEYPSLKRRCEETATLAKRAKLIVVPNTSHRIDFLTYQKAIIDALHLPE